MEEKAIKNGQSAAFMQPGNDGGVWDSGMSKREYFAAMAMQGYLASYAVDGAASPKPGHAAEWSVKYADALLLELEKTVQ